METKSIDIPTSSSCIKKKLTMNEENSISSSSPKVKSSIRFSSDESSGSEQPLSPRITSKSADSSNINSLTEDMVMSSIPNDIKVKVENWLVKYAFITRGSSKLVSTSKQHKFKSPVKLETAIKYIISSGAKDSTLVFENDNGLIFTEGVFDSLDLVDDE
eukprot:gene446-564_t